jgi:hypothetical protein
MATVDLRPQNVDIYMAPSDSLEIVIGLVDSTGQPLNTSGYVVTAEALSRDGRVVVFGQSLVGANLTLTLSASVSAAMAGVWRWFVQTDNQAGNVRTVVFGGLTVTEGSRG